VTSVDTNVVVRFLIRDIPAQAAKAIRLLEGTQCYITDVAITETIFVLEKVYAADRNDIAATIKGLIFRPNLRCNRDLITSVLDLYKQRRSLSIIDCYAAIESKTFGNDLATFDRDLLKHGGSHVIEPLLK
jgi:predicted nucleic-acid-binding protein